MGVVYLAEDARGDRVAVKVLSGSHGMGPQLRARLAREARALTVLSDPHVVRVLEVAADAEQPFLVMSYAQGLPLDRAVPAGGFRAEQVQVFGGQLAGALADAHAHGIAHRDLKPNNVVLGAGGVTLVDFGIASLQEDSETALTRAGAVVGSLAWLAPEVIAGAAADERSDVFGLGLVLGFMALGRHPYGTARPEAVMYRIMHEAPDLDGCPAQLRPLLAAALQRDPDARPGAAALRTGLLHGGWPSAPAVPGAPRSRGRSVRPLLAGLGAAVVAAALAVASGTGQSVEQTAATSAQSAAPTAQPAPAPADQAPDAPPRIGRLSIGMSMQDATATGEAVLDPDPYGDGSGPASLYASDGDGPGICTSDGRISDFIVKTAGWRSPEGIGQGSAAADVLAAYPNAVRDGGGYNDPMYYYLLVDRGGWGYQFFISEGVVDIVAYGSQSGSALFMDC